MTNTWKVGSGTVVRSLTYCLENHYEDIQEIILAPSAKSPTLILWVFLERKIQRGMNCRPDLFAQIRNLCYSLSRSKNKFA